MARSVCDFGFGWSSAVGCVDFSVRRISIDWKVNVVSDSEADSVM